MNPSDIHVHKHIMHTYIAAYKSGFHFGVGAFIPLIKQLIDVPLVPPPPSFVYTLVIDANIIMLEIHTIIDAVQIPLIMERVNSVSRDIYHNTSFEGLRTTVS